MDINDPRYVEIKRKVEAWLYVHANNLSVNMNRTSSLESQPSTSSSGFKETTRNGYMNDIMRREKLGLERLMLRKWERNLMVKRETRHIISREDPELFSICEHFVRENLVFYDGFTFQNASMLAGRIRYQAAAYLAVDEFSGQINSDDYVKAFAELTSEKLGKQNSERAAVNLK